MGVYMAKRSIIPILFFTSVIFSFMAQPVSADVVTWGGSSSSWSNPDRWVGGQVPGPDDDVMIPSGTCSLDIDTTVKSVSITGGHLTIGANTLIVNGASSTTGSTHTSFLSRNPALSAITFMCLQRTVRELSPTLISIGSRREESCSQLS